MNAALILIIAIALLVIGYVCYGGWLAKQWGIDPSRKTPAHELEDGVDYVPAKAPVLMGHHFSSIAGAGPINGPIQAAAFGWLPVLLWVIIGGIFFGGVHDFGALFASVRHKGQSIGEVIDSSMGKTAKRLFIIFAVGPMNSMPSSSHACANTGFSARNPYPGWMASIPFVFAHQINHKNFYFLVFQFLKVLNY